MNTSVLRPHWTRSHSLAETSQRVDYLLGDGRLTQRANV